MCQLLWLIPWFLLIQNSWGDHPTITEHLIESTESAKYPSAIPGSNEGLGLTFSSVPLKLQNLKLKGSGKDPSSLPQPFYRSVAPSLDAIDNSVGEGKDRAKLAEMAHDLAEQGRIGTSKAKGDFMGHAITLSSDTDPIVKDAGKKLNEWSAEEMRMNGMMKNSHDGNRLQHKLLTGEFGQSGSTLQHGLSSNAGISSLGANGVPGRSGTSVLPAYLRRSLEERGIRPEAVEEKLKSGNIEGAKQLLSGLGSPSEASKGTAQGTDSLVEAILSRYSNTPSGLSGSQFHRSTATSDEKGAGSSEIFSGDDSSKSREADSDESDSDVEGEHELSTSPKVYGVTFKSIPFVGEAPQSEGSSKFFESKDQPTIKLKSHRVGRIARVRLYKLGVYAGNGSSIFQIAHRQYQQWQIYTRSKRVAQNNF